MNRKLKIKTKFLRAAAYAAFQSYAKVLVFIFSLSLTALAAHAQDGKDIRRTSFNFGGRTSFSSMFYSVEKLYIEGTDITDFTTKSEVSLSYAAFARLNIRHHYLQTELCYNISRYSILFPTTLWNTDATSSDVSTISTELRGLEMPLFYGYYLEDHSPYRMSVFVGPKINFILPGQSRHLFENFSQADIDETIWPFIFSGVIGFNVSISHLVFDISFEAGLNNISRYFTTINPQGQVSTDDFIFNRRKNGVSFSIGAIF